MSKFIEEIKNYSTLRPKDAQGYVERVLTDAGFCAGDIDSAIGNQFGKALDTLYVSTATNGLFGSTSDIDIILILPDNTEDSPQISTMMFVKENRLGVKCYTKDQVDTALQELTHMVGETPKNIQSLITQLKKSTGVPWIDLERCINGFSFSTFGPYSEHLASLSTVWFSTAFEQFRRAAFLTILSEWAGEIRGKWGYLLVSLRHAMDAIMASYGRIQSSEKWIDERWVRFRNETKDAISTPDPLMKNISELSEWTRQHLCTGNKYSVTEKIRMLYDEIKSVYQISLTEDEYPIQTTSSLKLAPFMGSAHFASAPESDSYAVVELESLDQLAEFSFLTGTAPSAKTANAILTLFRAGLIDTPLDMTQLNL